MNEQYPMSFYGPGTMTPRQVSSPVLNAHFAQRHIDPKPGIMAWDGIMFYDRSPLEQIDGSLTADSYIT